MAASAFYSTHQMHNNECEENDETISGLTLDYFQIENCSSFILSNDSFSRICLQFPDSLLKYATLVTSKLQETTCRKCFTLADTSFGSCCVDEVAAKHVNADALIHFGHSCLSRTENLPVLYVFGECPFNIEVFIRNLQNNFKLDEKLLFFYDVSYEHVMLKYKYRVNEVFIHSIVSTLLDSSTADEQSDKVFGRSYKLNHHVSEYKIVFIGEEGTALNNFILFFNKNQLFSYSPTRNDFRKEGVAVNKFLMKRFYLIERAKDASIIGIIVGTLASAKYKDIIERLKTILRKARKRFYVFLVGKVNVAKLANFMEIDMFVNIACTESSCIDSKDFYKPIITPFELEIACLSNREWTGDYLVDFCDLLPGSSNHVQIEDKINENSEPEYSLITGKLRRTELHENDCAGSSGELVKRNISGEMVSYNPQNAAEFLSTRSWQGLDKDVHTEVKKAHAGRSGIAMSYKNENS